MSKALKLTVSGYYNAANNEKIDFEKVDLIVPFNDEDVAFMHARRRQLMVFLRNNTEKFPKRPTHIQQVFLDNVEETKAEFSYEGKSIKDLDPEEIQDFALVKDIREVPLFREGSTQNARKQAYVGYSTVCLNKKLDRNMTDNEYTALPDLKADSKPYSRRDIPLSNDDVIAQEQDNTRDNPTRMTMKELKEIATQRNIQFHSTIGYDALWAKIYKPTE